MYDNIVLDYILVGVQICYPAYIYGFCHSNEQFVYKYHVFCAKRIHFTPLNQIFSCLSCCSQNSLEIIQWNILITSRATDKYSFVKEKKEKSKWKHQGWKLCVREKLSL